MVEPDPRALARRHAVRLALRYGVLAGLYIVLSSVVLGAVPIDAGSHALIETVKGLAFVAITALVLAGMLYRDYVGLAEARAKQRASAEALARAHHAAMLSVVTSAIAHDMRNLLATLGASLEFVQVVELMDPDAREALADSHEAQRRLIQLTSDLMTRASGTAAKENTVVIVSDVVKDCVKLTSLFARGHRCEFDVDLDEGCTVRARRQEIECAILNLLLNAVDANARSGKIHVSVAREARGVVLRVRDSGPGVPGNLSERIFEPFFTTKGEQGNGVGLAVTRELARAYGGDVRLSDAGPGAEFELSLPSAA